MQTAVPKGQGGMLAVLGSDVEKINEIIETNKVDVVSNNNYIYFYEKIETKTQPILVKEACKRKLDKDEEGKVVSGMEEGPYAEAITNKKGVLHDELNAGPMRTMLALKLPWNANATSLGEKYSGSIPVRRKYKLLSDVFSTSIHTG